MTQTGNHSHNNEKTVPYIKKKISENHSPDKYINLFHCLDELGDLSLVNETFLNLGYGGLSKVKRSSSQWSAVVFVLLTSEWGKYQLELNRLIGEKNKLSNCGITAEGCAALASALRSTASLLRDLDLNFNDIGDSGVKLLSAGLENSYCKLETLRLRQCGVTDESCAALASALRSNPSNLRQLKLTENKLGDSGVKLLSAGLKSPHCKLEALKLKDCGVTEEGCAALASALTSNPSHLRELGLDGNNIGNSGVKLLSAVLEIPHFKLENLRLMDCGITEEGCVALASALRSNPSHLRVLVLEGNKLGNSGVELLSELKNNPHYKLQLLW
ncbi:Ribonuclease inhibitor [Anabarilius grahami]|uniref:Ribonuclease inhibitor n=1 Tax=Anabarilius grahami TaxID=495550 RepID=A0A3N0XTC6_ANAGA|nr:Ribonuclease inhibitor [Anabarilius grahami]